MNYTKLYRLIIERSECRDIKNDYYEKHHIVPRCLGGNDSADNIAILTAREHYVVHQILMKMYPDNKKLIYAANMMTVHDTNNRSCNRRYEWIRRKFSDNHPCKTQEVKDKISKTLSAYYASDEYRNIIEHKRSLYMETRTCRCGCGNTFNANIKDTKQYFKASHIKRNPIRQRVSLKEFLSGLTHEEMSVRMKKSCGSCDEKQRAMSISNGKKGVKTNQQEIMGRRYANMTDDEFRSFLSTKSDTVQTRILNLRNKWQKILQKSI